MRAEVFSISSTDAEFLEKWHPTEPEFSLPLRLIVGPEGSDGEESFDLTVCTGGWLEARSRAMGIVDGRHHLVVSQFNWLAIRDYIERRVRDCQGETWNDVAQLLSRFAYWEFEDYRPNGVD